MAHVDQTSFFEMEGDYQKTVRIEQNATTTRFHVQICDHLAAVQREYDVDVPAGDLISVQKNDLFVIATVRVGRVFKRAKKIYI